GRDHHPQAYTMWFAGGGIQPGVTMGATDELGFNVVEDSVHVHDIQATILHLLGLDHERLTFRHQGRDYRLTDVHGQVVQQLIA
ncbi:MAG TPA: sulfatase, partial [Verrucomicrobiales bacterium]|nr:sulfatase [Verrucomicrobiales bacterium]